ncbi:glycosyltransferase [Xenorhabdus sp. IM139775]|uniref:glycosyltransferase n=1 Tax=Xenorhabdus sp. IM139775 TaxID=3025876 RepID=UPI002359DC91|nr:glycosyltransferase [Xenorhabdus sp. IM139775]MDC9592793.1 glycosyltransferase [Xenorhabdus sp. IM139775]
MNKIKLTDRIISTFEKEYPKVSVIVPTYHDWERLEKCLTALRKQNYPKERLEILIINNDPNDTPPINLYFNKNEFFLSEKKPGSYAARNKGLITATGSIIAFTDSDCIPEPDWIVNAVNKFIDNPEIKRIGGNIKLFYKEKKLTIAEKYEKIYAFRQKEYINTQGMAVTANMFSYSYLFEEIGYFNESLYSGGDSEWGRRAKKSGYNIHYFNDVTVYHPARSKLSELILKNRREAAGKLRVNKLKNIDFLLSIVIHILPPIKSIKIIDSREAKTTERILAFFIRYLLRINTALEYIRVGVFKNNAERK